jgi:hypothetical protein
VTLTYTELIVTCDGERVVTPVSPEEWPAVLADRFGIAVRVGVGRVSGQL